MKFLGKKSKRVFWEIRRCFIILLIYSLFMVLAILTVLAVLSLPEIIAGLIFGF